jgi:cytochrome c-type biogenesis protein CcmH/NrfG
MKLITHLRRVLPGLILSIFLPCAMAQQSPPTAGGGSTGGSRGDTSNKVPSIKPQPTTPLPQKPNLQSLFITGTVVMEDGTPPPTGAVIERMCGGRTKKEAYVNPTGYFGFQIGGATTFSVIPEASDDTFGGMDSFGGRMSQMGMGSSTGMPQSSGLMGCELRAQLTGYRSSIITLDGFNPIGQLEVGTIVLHAIEKVQGTTISLTDMQAPKEAKKAVDRAGKAVKNKNFEEAEKDLKTAVGFYPGYASAWYQLGQVYQLQKRFQDARGAYDKSIAADSRYVNPYIQLARLAGMEQKWQEVADITDRAMALDPLDFPEGYYFNCLAYFSLNKLDAAERSARRTYRLDGQHRFPRIHLILAEILRRKPDLPGSIEQLQAYLKFAPAATDADKIRSLIDEMEKSAKTLASSQPDNQ